MLSILLAIGTISITTAQIKLLKTITYEKNIHQFPLGIKQVDEFTPVILNTPPQNIHNSKKEPVAMLTDGDFSNNKEEREQLQLKPALPLEQYWLRTKPGILLPVKVSGEILNFNATEIITWDYNQFVFSKYTVSSGKLKQSPSTKIGNIQRDCYMQVELLPNGESLFVNEVSTHQKVEDAERIDFYDSSFKLRNSYTTVLKANVQIAPLNNDSLIIAEFSNADRKINLALFSLKNGLLQSTSFETEMKVSSLPMHYLNIDESGKILVTYNADIESKAQVIVFNADFTFDRKLDLNGQLVSFVSVFKDAPILLATFTGSVMKGDAKYVKINYATSSVIESKLISSFFGTTSSEWKVFMPLGEKMLDNNKAVSVLSMFYSPIHAFSEKRKLIIVDLLKTYTLDLIPVEFITLALSNQKVGLYRGKQLNIYTF